MKLFLVFHQLAYPWLVILLFPAKTVLPATRLRINFWLVWRAGYLACGEGMVVVFEWLLSSELTINVVVVAVVDTLIETII